MNSMALWAVFGMVSNGVALQSDEPKAPRILVPLPNPDRVTVGWRKINHDKLLAILKHVEGVGRANIEEGGLVIDVARGRRLRLMEISKALHEATVEYGSPPKVPHESPTLLTGTVEFELWDPSGERTLSDDEVSQVVEVLGKFGAAIRKDFSVVVNITNPKGVTFGQVNHAAIDALRPEELARDGGVSMFFHDVIWTGLPEEKPKAPKPDEK